MDALKQFYNTEPRCNDSYQSLTLHYIAKNWEYKKWTVECKNAQGRHTGESIAALTDMMICNISGLQPETYKTMTTDAASNMRKAMEESFVATATHRSSSKTDLLKKTALENGGNVIIILK